MHSMYIFLSRSRYTRMFLSSRTNYINQQNNESYYRGKFMTVKSSLRLNVSSGTQQWLRYDLGDLHNSIDKSNLNRF